MIKFKERDFSTPATKTLYVATKAKNTVASGIKRVPRKTNIQSAREAIRLKNKVKGVDNKIKSKVVDSVLNAATKVERAMYNPGEVVSNGVGTVISNPVGTATYIATSPLPVPSSIIAPAVNKVAKKVPVYDKMTKKLGELWSNSNTSKNLKKIDGFTLGNYARAIPIG